MFFDFKKMLENLARKNVETRMTDEQFIVTEINRFKTSRKHKSMIDGDRYYQGKHDILHKKRMAIGDDGGLVEIRNLPNNKIIDNQYRKMVDQKVNYLVGQPFLINSDDEDFIKVIKPYIQTKRFIKTLKAVERDALNCGIGWLFPCYDDKGILQLKRIRPWELIPLWADSEHTRLDSAIRTYEVITYIGKEEKIVTKVEVFDDKGISYFELTDGGKLIPEEPYNQPYFTIADGEGNETGYNWDKIPLVAFKYNEDEQPLITKCKGLQDGLNKIESMWEDQMEEDPRNTILVLVNYDGTNLGEFRQNLANYGAVKVRSVDGSGGDVRTLQIEVNSDNFKAIIEQFKKAIIENCMGYDAKDDRMGGNANEMNLKSMYSDIELDANSMETELQASFEELIWFLQCHIANTVGADFEQADYQIIFNRNIMINESNIIADCKNSIGVISTETIIAKHPWVKDVTAELERLKKEENIEVYGVKNEE